MIELYRTLTARRDVGPGVSQVHLNLLWDLEAQFSALSQWIDSEAQEDPHLLRDPPQQWAHTELQHYDEVVGGDAFGPEALRDVFRAAILNALSQLAIRVALQLITGPWQVDAARVAHDKLATPEILTEAWSKVTSDMIYIYIYV